VLLERGEPFFAGNDRVILNVHWLFSCGRRGK
jgi:hypothetical protein